VGSIVRFGEMPLILKRLSEPLTATKGQLILESFTFDDGTNLKSGLACALKDGFSRLVPREFGFNTKVHRCCMILTDGFVPTSEDARASFQAVLKAAEGGGSRPKISMLGLTDDHSRTMVDQLYAGMHFLTGGKEVRR
jgi:hypothetical protein